MGKAAKKAASKKPATDWRGAMLQRVRKIIADADPEIVEEAKWKKPSNPAGVPTWSHCGIICTGETYKDKVKFTFAKGASLPDPAKLFNASLDAGTRRAIDMRDGDKLNEKAFAALIKAAIAANAPKKSPSAAEPGKTLPHRHDRAQPTPTIRPRRGMELAPSSCVQATLHTLTANGGRHSNLFRRDP